MRNIIMGVMGMMGAMGAMGVMGIMGIMGAMSKRTEGQQHCCCMVDCFFCHADISGG